MILTCAWVLGAIGIMLIPASAIRLVLGEGDAFMMKSLLFFSLPAVILWRVGNTHDEYHTSGIEEDVPIYSLRDRMELHGGFVLGTGSIDGEDYYAYYTKGEFGGYLK